MVVFGRILDLTYKPERIRPFSGSYLTGQNGARGRPRHLSYSKSARYRCQDSTLQNLKCRPSVAIEDEDGSAAACEIGLILCGEATGARTALDEVKRCLRSHTEPFGRVGWDRLKEAVGLPLAPIRFLQHVETP